jgi:FkbH-like protein
LCGRAVRRPARWAITSAGKERHRHRVCVVGPNRQGIVLDLDSTLGAVLLGTTASPGWCLEMVSKNDHVNSAIMPFREHPHMDLTEDDISVFVTNWENKPDNIRTIQKILNIGFESIVFLDDNPFERNAVREFLPSVMVPELPEDPAHYVRA